MKETRYIERKSFWQDEDLKLLCGLANTDGGLLLIGEHPYHASPNLNEARQLLTTLPETIQAALGIVVDIELRREAEQVYLEIAVAAHPSPISYHGEYYYRSGKRILCLQGAALHRFLLARQGCYWDGLPLPALTLADLDPLTLQTFRQQTGSPQGEQAGAAEEDDQTLLERLHLWAGAYLTQAAALLFHPRPEQFFGGAYIRIAHFAGEASTRHQDEIHGDLLRQLHQTIEVLQARYLRVSITYSGRQRLESWPMPISALHEALLNAVLHRDYSVATPIQISVYPDCLMIWNPGQLPAEWTVDRLLAKHPAIPFNPALANAFLRAGISASWGQGIEQILEACRAAGTPQPEIRHESGGLWVIFPFLPEHQPPVEKKKNRITGEVTRVETGDVTGEETSEVAVEVKGEVAGDVSVEVTGEVNKLLLACHGVLARRELREALQLKGDDNFRHLYLSPALAARLIEMTVPDKPNSRLQKYRLTAQGLALREALLKGK